METSIDEREDVIHCDLIDLEQAVIMAFKSGRTPLIVDNSEDDKVSTYYSYQPDAILLETTKMIVDNTKKPLQEVLEYARVRLMSAMKYGM
jgi:hypothetical protein